jgi:hypothetical protein
VKVVLGALERAGCAPRPSGSGWISRCPGHADQQPSLSIGEGRDGRVLLKCWAGCETAAVVDAIELTWADLFAPASRVRGRGA